MMDVWFDSEQLAYGVPVTFNNADAGMYIAFSTQGSSSSVYMDNITLSNAVPGKPDASALGIVSSVPVNGAENVDVDNAEFKVSFNCALSPESVDGSVSIDNGAEISDLSYDEGSDSVTFKVSKLTYSTSYAIIFSDELTGINGEKFDKDTKFNIIRFSTESEPPPPVTTTIDFESNDVPEVFKRYGGKASIVAGMSADQKGNACYMQYGSMYDIDDSIPWVTMDKIYFNADVCAEEGTSFMCFATRRYGGYAAFVTLNNGDIMIGTQKVGSYTPGKWYELTAVIDRSVDKIDVWFDGIMVADDAAINFEHKDVTNSFLSFKTDDNGGAYLDDITVSNEVLHIGQKELFKIKSSLPNDSAENLGIEKTHFVVSFDRALLEETVYGSVSVNNDAVVSNVSYNSEANSIEFDVENLSYDTSYTVTFSDSLTGINGEVLNAFTGGNAVKFTTGKVTVEDIVYTIGNNTAESLLPGEVTPSAKVKNETSQSVSLVYVVALCKGSEDCYEIVSSKKGNISEIAPMGETQISETISVESADGYFVKLFVWGSMDDLNPFIIAKAFR